MSKYLFTNRLFIGALGLFILFVTGCLFYLQYVEQQNAKEHARTEERLKQWREEHRYEAVPTTQTPDPPKIETPAEETTPDGHSHDDEWHAEPHPPVVPPATAQGNREQTTPVAEVTQTYDGPLTYHAELLETHPVEALRAQAKERGHWSAKWIPPFPPDDHGAAAIARDNYLMTYYESIGDTTNPIFLKAYRNWDVQRIAEHKKGSELSKRSDTFTWKDRIPPSEAYKRFRWELARMSDLGTLHWIRLPAEDARESHERRPSNFPTPE